MNTTTTDPPGPRIGSLCSGYGGLDEAVRSIFGGSLAWVSDIDPGACKILAHRYPDIRNLGDFTTVDWAGVEPVDIATAGYPCQPFSHAGRREGTSDERHLWPYVAAGVAALRPALCVFENVRGHLTLGFDEVLRDLDYLGYDTDWHLLEAAEVGAPHRRSRLFILARRRTDGQLHRWADRRGGLPRDLARQGGGHVHDPHSGRDGHEVDARAVAAACPVRGADDEASPRDGGECGEGRVGARRRGRVLATRAGQVASGAEGGSGGMPGRPVGVDPEEPGSEGPAALGRLAAPSCTAPDVAGTGGQPAGAAGAGAGSAASPPSGGSSLGRVVGAGRRPLRSSDVPWAAAQFRDDAERTGIRAPHGRFRVFVLAWHAGGASADAHDLVHRVERRGVPSAQASGERRGAGADRRPADCGRGAVAGPLAPVQDADSATGGERRIAAPGQAEGRGARADTGGRGGAPAAHPHDTAADRDGRNEGWPEPEGFVGGSDAAVSGDAAPHAHCSGCEACVGRPGAGEPRRLQPVVDSGPTGGPGDLVVADDRCATCGDLVDYHDEGGFCAGLCGGTCTDPEWGRPGWVDDGEPLPPAFGDAEAAADTRSERRDRWSGVERVGREAPERVEAGRHAGVSAVAWGDYEPAIRRWERRLGRPAPAPTEPGSKGQPRLSPRFVEFMMGLPAGWVTDVPGLSRNDQLKALGNGVVPQQAAAAVRFMLARLDEERRWAA